MCGIGFKVYWEILICMELIMYGNFVYIKKNIEVKYESVLLDFEM